MITGGSTVLAGRDSVETRRLLTRRQQAKWQGRSLYWLLCLALCAVAWLLRLFWNGRQSLWYDEAFSVSLATEPLHWMVVDTAHDVHPPLYYALLHLWILGAGTSEMAVRALSTWCGTLVVAALIVLATRMAGRAAGLVAGAAGCFSPFLVYYGQEARMYALLALLSTLSGYAFLRATAGERRWWLVYTGALATALWTQLYAVLLFAALGLWYVARIAAAEMGAAVPAWHAASLGIVAPGMADGGWSRDGSGDPREAFRRGAGWLATQWPRHRDWLLAQVAIVALFAPWLPVAISRMHDYVNPGHGSPLHTVLHQTALVFALGFSAVDVTSFPMAFQRVPEWLLTAGLVLPFLVCLAFGATAAARRSWGMLLWWLVVPIAGMYVLSLGVRDFNARYLMEAAPAFFALVALGLTWVWRAIGRLASVVLGLVLVADCAFMLAGLYGDPYYARDDNREVASLVTRGVVPGAGVVLDAAYEERAFDYYSHHRWPASTLPVRVNQDPAAATASLQVFTAGRPQVWLVLWQDYYTDPQGVVWSWLLHHFYATDWWNVHGGLKLLRFDALPSSGVEASGATFGDAVQLVAFSTQPSRDDAAGVDEVQLDLYWQFLSRPGADFAVAAHVLDDAGNDYGDAHGQPAGGHLPASFFTGGERLHTVERLKLQPWTGPGSYRVQVILYNPHTMAPLAVRGSGANGASVMLPLALPPRADAVTASAPLPAGAGTVDATFAGVGTLDGYQVTTQGPDSVLTLYWRADGPTSRPYKVFVHALDAHGRVLATGDADPVVGAAPTTTWHAGETVRDPHHLRLPAGASVSACEVGLYDPVSGERVPVRLDDGATPPDRAVRLACDS